MSSNIGNVIKVQIFGESHGKAIGAVIDGAPAGYKIDGEKIALQMARRAPGNGKFATQRKEADEVEILSGLLDDVTTGMPICAVIRNSDQHSSDYSDLSDTPRPSHADFPAKEKYGIFDLRGSGHFSGRLTAPVTFAGALLKQILEKKGITVASHISNIGGICDDDFDKVNLSSQLLNKLNLSPFPVINEQKGEKMLKCIEDAKSGKDSVGGQVEIAVLGLPVGVGEPMFRGVESVISSALFGIPAVKSVSFGVGEGFANMRGSQANDSYTFEDRVKTLSNNNGGVLGGITTGMPLIVRVTLKPTPSIAREQQTVDLKEKKNCTIEIKGRHDPCIVPRACAPLESAVIIAIADLMKEGNLL